jgi:cbb3-type cytochrome oxidase subunit 3
MADWNIMLKIALVALIVVIILVLLGVTGHF